MKKHGLAIGLERTGTTFYLTMKIVGKLTHDDYKTLTPLIDNAVAAVPSAKIRAYVDITELEVALVLLFRFFMSLYKQLKYSSKRGS